VGALSRRQFLTVVGGIAAAGALPRDFLAEKLAQPVSRAAQTSATSTLDRTILLLEDGEVHSRSTAALRALRHLKGPARWLYPLILLPKFLRDPVYDVVARNRIRWFGRLESCLVPTPQTRDRFIDL